MNLAVIRSIATGIIASLAVLQEHYPHNIPIMMAIAFAGAIAVHSIPSITQGIPAMTEFPAQKTAANPQTTPDAYTIDQSDMAVTAPDPANVMGPVSAPVEVAPELTDPLGVKGSTLMGITPPQAETRVDGVPAPVEDNPKVVVEDAVPVASLQGSPVSQEDVDTLIGYLKMHSQVLREMADGLKKLIDV